MRVYIIVHFITGTCMLQVAEAHVDEFTKTLGYAKPNLRFVEGHMEFLDKAGIPDGSVDLIISNCVINLSPDKQRVLNEAYRVLAPGGELYFSDVYSSRRVPEAARKDEVTHRSSGFYPSKSVLPRMPLIVPSSFQSCPCCILSFGMHGVLSYTTGSSPVNYQPAKP